MKTMFMGGAVLASVLMLAPGAADAKGCIKGAVAGGAAGHLAHHTITGAIGGCVVGRHAAKRQQQQPAPASPGQ